MAAECRYCGMSHNFCRCDFEPAPGLSPDMLSDEDRELLKFIKGCIDQCGSSPNYAGLWQIYCVPAMRLIDRLLADNHGEG